MSEQELTRKIESLEAKLQESADSQEIEQLGESYSHLKGDDKWGIGNDKYDERARYLLFDSLMQKHFS